MEKVESAPASPASPDARTSTSTEVTPGAGWMVIATRGAGGTRGAAGGAEGDADAGGATTVRADGASGQRGGAHAGARRPAIERRARLIFMTGDTGGA